jgi:hypothetical protein
MSNFNLFNFYNLDFVKIGGSPDKNKPLIAQYTIEQFFNQNEIDNPILEDSKVEKILSSSDDSYSFLGEAYVVNTGIGLSLRTIYLKSMNLDKGNIEEVDYKGEAGPFRIGNIILPKKFRYVCYKRGNLGFEITKILPERDKVIFAPVILELGDVEGAGNDIDLFHFCQNIAPAGGGEACKKLGLSIKSQSFHLFLYSGELFFPQDSNPRRGNFYLIPFVLSEGVVTYYAIEEKIDGSHKNVLNYILENQSSINFFEVSTPLKYNDELGVFIFSEIKFRY